MPRRSSRDMRMPATIPVTVAAAITAPRATTAPTDRAAPGASPSVARRLPRPNRSLVWSFMPRAVALMKGAHDGVVGAEVADQKDEMVLLRPVPVPQVEPPSLLVRRGDVLDHGVRHVEESVAGAGHSQAEVALLAHAGPEVAVPDAADLVQHPATKRHVGPEQVVDRHHPTGVGREVAGEGAIGQEPADGVRPLGELVRLATDLATADGTDARVVVGDEQVAPANRARRRRRRRRRRSPPQRPSRRPCCERWPSPRDRQWSSGT